MRALHFAVSLVIVFGLVGCGADTVMPDVTGKKLDVAKGDIKDAGFKDDVKTDGGGLFGVVVESNWTVCEQSPAAGKNLAAAPKLTIARSCEDDSTDPSETPSATADPSAIPSPTAAPIADITVDDLLDKLNSSGMGGIQVGDQFRLTGTLFESDAWGVGASGEFNVMLRAKGGKDDLSVFVNQTDSKKWKNGTTVEMVVAMTEATINGETTDGWLTAQSVKTLSGGTTEKAKEAAATKKVFKDLAGYADIMNTSLGRTVIDSIEPASGGAIYVYMNPNMAGVTADQARTLIAQWNKNIMDTLDADNWSGSGSVKYLLTGNLVAENKEILDPWSVKFRGMLDD